MSAEPDVVHLELSGGIATITLDSQHNRNALSRQLLAELHRALDTAEQADAASDRAHPSPVRRSAPAPT